MGCSAEIFMFFGSFVLFVCSIGGLIVGIIGAPMYASEKHAESVYRPTMCMVKNYTQIVKVCESESCDSDTGSSSFSGPRGRGCTTTYYRCDEHIYTVLYNVSNQGAIETTFIDSNGPKPPTVSPNL